MNEPISTELVVERLREDNPWWGNESIPEYFNSMTRRLYQPLFEQLLVRWRPVRAMVLMGPRRVGKTVLQHHAIKHLIKAKNTNPRKIAYIAVDSPVCSGLSLDQLFKMARATTGHSEAEGWYIFFDEVQYLLNWEVHLKVLVDTYPDTKFVASGSAAAALKAKSKESGAGRFTDFMLPPLTFQEYLHLKGKDSLVFPSLIKWGRGSIKTFNAIDIKNLNNEWYRYLNVGGFPEAVLVDVVNKEAERYIRSDIVDKVLLRDLPNLYGISDVQMLYKLFTNIAFHTGKEFTWDNLGRYSGIDVITLRKYVEYLEAAFLIKKVSRVDYAGRRYARETAFQLYLTNPSLRAALFAPVHADSADLGFIVQTAVVAQWLHRDWQTLHYARWKEGKTDLEVDIVGLEKSNIKPSWAVEIKWENSVLDKSANHFRGILTFCKQNKLTQALIVTKQETGRHTFEDVELVYIPAALYGCTVSARTLEQKIEEEPRQPFV